MALSSDAQSRPVAFCAVHGLFDQLEMTGPAVPCPDCGRQSRVLRERLKQVMLESHAVVSTALTITAVFNMRDLLERIQRGETSAEKAVEEARTIDGQFARVVAMSYRLEFWPAPVLISMLSLYFRLKDDYSGRVQIGNLLRIMERQRESFDRLRAALGIIGPAPAAPPTPPSE